MSIFAGYSLARIPFKGKGLLSGFILFAYVFPPFILILALYSLLQSLHLHNTLPGLMLLHLIIVVPYCTWALRGYFLSVPKELEDAAMIDGCSRIGALFRVVLPVSAPGVASAGIFSFTLSWGEMLFAMIVLDSYEKFTLPVALRTMVVGDFVRWGDLMAAVIIAVLPPVVFYLLLQRYVVQGLTAGAIK
jgi:multiple sugar transport system permease protein